MASIGGQLWGIEALALEFSNIAVANVAGEEEQTIDVTIVPSLREPRKELVPIRVNSKNNTKIFSTSPIVFATQLAPQNGKSTFKHIPSIHVL